MVTAIYINLIKNSFINNLFFICIQPFLVEEKTLLLLAIFNRFSVRIYDREKYINV